MHNINKNNMSKHAYVCKLYQGHYL